MPRSGIERIRECIRERRYDLTAHAVDEMADDQLDILDVESALLSGRIIRVERADPRGTTLIVHGQAADDKTSVGIVGRFKGDRRFLVITVYEVS